MKFKPNFHSATIKDQMKNIILTHTHVIYEKGLDTRKIPIEESVAYKRGFIDALKKGVDNNPYSWDEYRHLYRIGYDAGITEYCRREHPEEE